METLRLGDRMTSDWVALAVGLLLTIGTGLFVASEFSLVNLDRAEIEARQGRGESMLGPVIRGLKRTSTLLSSAQLGITLTTLTTGFLVEPALSRFLTPGAHRDRAAEGGDPGRRDHARGHDRDPASR